MKFNSFIIILKKHIIGSFESTANKDFSFNNFKIIYLTHLITMNTQNIVINIIRL